MLATKFTFATIATVTLLLVSDIPNANGLIREFLGIKKDNFLGERLNKPGAFGINGLYITSYNQMEDVSIAYGGYGTNPTQVEEIDIVCGNPKTAKNIQFRVYESLRTDSSFYTLQVPNGRRLFVPFKQVFDTKTGERCYLISSRCSNPVDLVYDNLGSVETVQGYIRQITDAIRYMRTKGWAFHINAGQACRNSGNNLMYMSFGNTYSRNLDTINLYQRKPVLDRINNFLWKLLGKLYAKTIPNGTLEQGIKMAQQKQGDLFFHLD
ncbi:hypothetical protein BDF19DRAFT_411761 [Syncephalis fuscata]|nr:hypothetical protein BDF19DRAFT_411761 [Syncephalis fuscata]